MQKCYIVCKKKKIREKEEIGDSAGRCNSREMWEICG